MPSGMIQCPKCKHEWEPTKSELASELGKQSLGKKKNYSDEEIKARTERLKAARKKYLDETFQPKSGDKFKAEKGKD